MSTDSPELVPITLVDLTEQDLIDAALASATTKLPEWEPREGNTEVVLLETQALIEAEKVYALNLLPDAVLDGLLALNDLQPDPGAQPVAVFGFATTSTTPTLIPTGTRIRIAFNDDTDATDFLTDADHVIAPNGSADLPATSEDTTSAVNNLPPGSPVQLIDSIAAVDTVTLVSIGGGRDPETSAEYRRRGAALFRTLNLTLVLPSQFTAAATKWPAVERAHAIDRYNGTDGTPGDDNGHITVAAGGPGGVALAAPDAAALLADLTAKAHAGLAIHVIAPTITTVPVTATIRVRPAYDPAAVEQAVEDALAAYLNPDTWEWSATVYRNELISLIDQVPGVERVVSIAAPAGDVPLAGVAPLAQAGALAVTAV